MPSRRKSNPSDDEIRNIQRYCFRLQMDLERIRTRLVATRDSITLPANAEAIWNGEAPPNVAIEIYGIIAVLVGDHVAEMLELLHRAATATPQSVSLAWNKLQHYRESKDESIN